MTLKVFISHGNPGYNKDALVTPVNPDTNEPLSHAPERRVSSGQTVEMYVHSGMALRVTEVDAESVATVQGGGGPGEVLPPV